MEEGGTVHKKHEREAPPHSVLGSLRALIPTHDRVAFAEALRVAEQQANKLLHLHGHPKLPIPAELIMELPKVTVEYTRHIVSGATFWHHHRQTWIIHLSRSDSPRRQRFTLAHEYKHIIDHGRHHLLYKGTRRTTAETQAERAADYFAGCLLVPRQLLKRAWHNGVTQTHRLAELFHVSEQAIEVRLRQCGLVHNKRRGLGSLALEDFPS
ncbi:Zn peptidase [Mycolicibacterium agri]|uniref:Zn peptidase n=1 Tax=Mycolicibacterium agri TaxID=36811 RepID=A0A2A7MP40_MYCAG|nr:ImmA/IrrE family metallo-endopeptidase [Mycolicibacterium agri]PEG33320.1 Zn peptidase [Mycolicibacterium agri]